MNIKDFSFLEGLQEGQITFDIWKPDEIEVVVGRTKIIEEDVFVQKCLDESIKIVRRVTGGGTVVLNDGCIIIDIGIFLPKGQRLKDFIYRCNQPIISALKKFKINAETDLEWPDIKVGERKICGCSLGVRGPRYLYSASIIGKDALILDAEKYLRVPTRHPIYRFSRSHKSFMVSLEGLGMKDDSDLILSIAREVNNEFFRD